MRLINVIGLVESGSTSAASEIGGEGSHAF
jgi:hypothetical protein